MLGSNPTPLPKAQPTGLFRYLFVIPVPCVFMLGYIAGAQAENALGRDRVHGQEFVAATGMALFIVGCALAAWGWMIFHLKGTTKIPGEASNVLVTSGPYKVTRNPMYVGCTLAYVGVAIHNGQLLTLPVLICVLAYVNWVVIPIEESRLAEVFGPAYDTYRLHVRRWL